MIVIDTSAAVALTTGEPECTVLAKKLAVHPDRSMSPVSYTELVMVLSRSYSQPKAAADKFIADMRIIVLSVDQDQSQQAVYAFLTYGKGRHPAKLNLGDCFSYAAAKVLNAPLLYVGGDFAKTDIKAA
ncbi:MAG: type II toxin-antitoxin system VapC family toxin [Rhizomicrobium sp.]